MLTARCLHTSPSGSARRARRAASPWAPPLRHYRAQQEALLARMNVLGCLKGLLPAAALTYIAARVYQRLGRSAKPNLGARALSGVAQGAPNLWLVVGLGNPTARYARTRHNVGFMVLDELARRQGTSLARQQFKAEVGSCALGPAARAVLAKPQTYMNLSGESVGRLARFYKVPVDRILVIYDDLDLATATVRLRSKGGHGGHNGMRSIIQHLGNSRDFPRIRIGIGKPAGNKAIVDHVLEDFSREEAADIEGAIQEAITVVLSVAELGVEKAVSGVRVKST